MQTGTERLEQLEAFATKIAAFQRGGVIRADDRQLLEHDEMIGEARTLVKQRPIIDPRLDLVVRSLVGNGVSRPVAPLFARDVLKALDAAS